MFCKVFSAKHYDYYVGYGMQKKYFKISLFSYCSCFLEFGPSLIGGILVPVALILLFNTTVFFMVFRRQHQRLGSSLTDRETTVKRSLRYARIMCPISFLLGLTWVFGFFAIGEAAVFFSYLFCAFNSFLGVFLFLWFIVRNKVARRAWRRILCRDNEENTRSRRHAINSDSGPRTSSTN